MSTDTQALNTIRHGEYYIPNADLCLMVEQFIFKVHRYFFERESEYFAQKLAVPTSAGGALPGSADHSAIILDRVTPVQFSNFLWVFYNPKFSVYEADLPVWQDILVLAHRWLFPEVKNLAVREIERNNMSDVARIKLYQDNHVDRSLLIRRYAALTEREDPINLQEGMDLGLETVLKIAAAREKARGIRLANGSLSPSTPTARGQDLFEVIRDVFNIDETAEAPVSVPATTTTVLAAAPSGGLKLSSPPVLAKPVPVLEVKTPVVKKPIPTPQESTPSPLPQNSAKKGAQKPKQQQQQKQQTAVQVDIPVNPKTSTSTSNAPQAQEPPLTASMPAPGQAKKATTTTKKETAKNKKNAKGGAAASQGADVETETEVKEEVKVNGESEDVKVEDVETKPDVPAKDVTKAEEEMPKIDVVPPSAGLEPPIEATEPPSEEVKEEPKVDKPLPVDPASTEPSTSDSTDPVAQDTTKPNGMPTANGTTTGDLILVDIVDNPFSFDKDLIIPVTPSQTQNPMGFDASMNNANSASQEGGSTSWPNWDM